MLLLKAKVLENIFTRILVLVHQIPVQLSRWYNEAEIILSCKRPHLVNYSKTFLFLQASFMQDIEWLQNPIPTTPKFPSQVFLTSSTSKVNE